MADKEGAQQALIDAIEALAKAAGNKPESAPSNTVKLASAARDLAEALAWIRSPGHSHGGSTVVEK